MQLVRSITFFAALASVAASVPARAQPLPTIRASGPSSDHTPIVFVHGVGADGLDLWFQFYGYFFEQKYLRGDATTFQYVSLDGAERGAEQLAREVDWLLEKTGKPKVDIISHSFGSLVTKLCVVEGGCRGKVAHWENLAGANNGTTFNLGDTQASRDIVVDGPLVKRLQARDDEEIARQGVRVQVQWTPTDRSIVPPELSREPYADNVELPGRISHQTILWDAEVIRRTYTFFQTAASDAPPTQPASAISTEP